MRDHLVSILQGQAFMFPRKNLKTGKTEQFIVQGNLRPIELWEYVFPEEHLNEVLYNLNIKGDGKQVHGKQLEPLAKTFRMMMGLKKIPKYDETKLQLSPRILKGAMEGVSLYGLGIKKDGKKDFKQWGYNQEAL